MNKFFLQLIFPAIVCICLVACGTGKTPAKSMAQHVVTTSVEHPVWSEDAVIYEVNIRQYTPQGTFEAFMEQLPRLEELGVDILWLMPIHPIGIVNRKGSLGSYYSIKDYLAVNPEYGTLQQLSDLVEEAHRLGMYVILDWVANHTSCDNELITKHPKFYKKDSLGNMVSPFDWTDVLQLDYSNMELRKYMIDAMSYWVKEADIDGFRCDVAGMVPCDFWNQARLALNEIKPVFMLAEDENEHCLMKEAFDMNYSWELFHLFNDIVKGTKTVADLKSYFEKQDSLYDPAIYRMNFITNHDENSWNGTEFERLGDAVEVFAMLTFTLPGMPLIYSGQEIGMNHRLSFFEKDTIHWGESEWENKYKKFIELKTELSILRNDDERGSLKILDIKKAPSVFAFLRENDNETMIVLANLSDEKVEFKLDKKFAENDYIDAFTSDESDPQKAIKLKGYEYLVLLEDF
jgi:glycosidase